MALECPTDATNALYARLGRHQKQNSHIQKCEMSTLEGSIWSGTRHRGSGARTSFNVLGVDAHALAQPFHSNRTQKRHTRCATGKF